MLRPIVLAVPQVVPDPEGNDECQRQDEIGREGGASGPAAAGERRHHHKKDGGEEAIGRQPFARVRQEQRHPSSSISRTDPRSPSRQTVVPVGIKRVASATPTIDGMPNSRAMIAPCDSIPPRSITRPDMSGNTGPHPGSVWRVTRTSPAWSLCASVTSARTVARAVTRPPQALVPVNTPGDEDGPLMAVPRASVGSR